MSKSREANRQPIQIQRTCALGVISFKELDWTDHVVQVVNLSNRGVGVESEEQMEPGLVWFRDRVGGFKGGVLLWSRKHNGRYRSGIRFVSLSDEDERALQFWQPCSGKRKPCGEHEEVISALMKSITRDDH